MDVVNGIVGKLFDLVLAPFAGAPTWGLVFVSVLSAAWALLLFRVVTPQARLAAARDRLLGHILEMGLYQDHLRVVGRIQRDLALANLRYLGTSLPALVALLVPMLLTLGQLEARFARRPLQVGESAVLAVTLSPAAAARLDGLTISAPSGVLVEAGPVRDSGAGAAAWRVRAAAPGRHELQVRLDGRPVATRMVAAGGGLPRTATTASTAWTHALLYPGEKQLPRGGEVSETRLIYPERTLRWLGLDLDWLVAFMAVSLAAGLALRKPLKVEI
ncbi:MAG: hypothetical protein IPK64_15125 [bacterium]|nr:hypothetical protein [bacterium]